MRMRRLLAPLSLAVATLLGSAAAAAAQTPLVPYFGKNNIRRPREMRDMTVPAGTSSMSAISV